MSWRYLLDTNVVSRLARRSPPARVLRRLEECDGLCAISSITAEELSFGARIAPADCREALEEFVGVVLRRFEVLAYDRAAALWVAERRSQLRWARRTVEHPDLCIAGVAGSLGMVLVSNNLRHFELLQGLEVEDWESADR